jgi:hypothetical protein
MKDLRWCSVFLVLFVCVPLFAQEKEDEAAKEKQRRRDVLVDSLISEARELKLPDNRAMIFARVGSQVWPADQKRAQSLFDEAIAELLAINAETAGANRSALQQAVSTSQQTRLQVLQTIAQRNADAALQSLYKTRHPLVERAMAAAPANDGKVRDMNMSHLAQNEISLEHTLMRQAAEQNPERTAAMLQAALKKGISPEVLNLLRKLHEKDPASAAEMGSEAISRLIRKGFVTSGQPDHMAVNTAFNFLGEQARERPDSDKSFRFSAGDTRSLLDKVITFVFEHGNLNGWGYTSQLKPIAERLSPDILPRLAEIERLNPVRGLRPYAVPSRLNDPALSIETVLAESAKLSIEEKRSVLHNVTNRLVAAGDVAGARQIVNDNYSGDALEDAKENLDSYYAHQLINAGKFAEAEALIEEFSDQRRIPAMVQLANTMFSRDPSAKTRALAVLARARLSLPDRPQVNNELFQIMQLIGAYANIEPVEGFKIFEGLLPQLNELSEASVVVNGFNSSFAIRRGEMAISAGSYGVPHIDIGVIRQLALKDFDRTMSLISGFSRREMRVQFKQHLLESQ